MYVVCIHLFKGQHQTLLYALSAFGNNFPSPVYIFHCRNAGKRHTLCAIVGANSFLQFAYQLVPVTLIINKYME